MSEKTNPTGAALPGGTVTFLFTDIAGSTQLLARLRQQYATVLAGQRELLRSAFARWNGREIDTQGDSFFVAFARAVDAVSCVVEAQRGLANYPWPEGVSVQVRMGLHTGEPWLAEEGYVGMSVHRAARIGSAGHGGQVLLSETTAALVRDDLPDDVGLLDLNVHSLKDIRRPEHIFQLVIPGLPADFPPLKTLEALKPAERGRTIRGYELRELLGRGSFGEVYRAVQLSVGRDVAIKVILPRYANDPDFIRSFETEAQLVARLEHPHIVPLYDYWRDPGGAYLVMRWLRSGSLEDALGHGGWQPEPAARLIDQVGAALAAAHQQGVVHRDIKPANILLDEAGNAYLSDFGIAALTGPMEALLRQDGGAVAVSSPGARQPAGQTPDEISSPGSLDYQSPEVAGGGETTRLADIFSLGVVLHELLTGQHPFAGTMGQALAQRQVAEPLPSVRAMRPELSPAVDVVIQTATAKDPAGRYQDAIQLARAFRTALTGEAPLALDSTATLFNPYKGLRAFHEADAGDFFGRKTMVQRLVAHLSPLPRTASHAASVAASLQVAPEGNSVTRFLAVVGPSGSGKSSLVRAGLIPALGQGAVPGSDRWLITEMVPGSHPFEEMEAALLRIAVNPPESLLSQLGEDARGLLRAVKRCLPADEQSELLLVVDQFEELFTLTAAPEARRFMDSIYAAATDPRSRVRIVITLRADFYDRPLTVPNFSELVREHTEAVTPLTTAELDEAIRGPARRVGVKLEEGLISRIVADVHDQPGALPLLQYALTELFEQRQGRLLTLAAYEEIGGVLGALGRRAENLFDELDEAGQEAARQLFLRLVTLGEGTEDTRRRVLRSELHSLGSEPSNVPAFDLARLDTVVDLYGRYRLLTFDKDAETREPTVEVAHEALVREWPRLRLWLDESRADVRMERLLASVAAEWQSAGRDPSYLLQGGRLGLFVGWSTGADLALTSDERAFLDASLAQRDAQAAEEMERQERERQLERRSVQRLRAIVAVLAIASVVGILLTLAVLNQSRIARQNEALAVEQRDRAEEAARVSTSRELASAAVTNLSEDPELSMLLALHGLETAHTGESVGALHQAVQESRVRKTMQEPGYSAFVTYSPDGALLLASGADGAEVWDMNEDVLRYTLPIDMWVSRSSFSPDGALIATSNDDGTVSAWNADTGQEVLTFKAHEDYVQHVLFSPDGARLATTSGDGTAKVWDWSATLAKGEGVLLQTLSGHEGPVENAAFSPDGARLVTASFADGTVKLWDIDQGEALHTLDLNSFGVAWSPDGRYLVTGEPTGELAVWDAESGEKATSAFTHNNGVIQTMTFNPDGSLLASAGGDGAARLWRFDAEGLQELMVLAGHDDQVIEPTFSPDGRFLATSSGDGTIRVWDISPAGRQELGAFAGHADRVTAIISPDRSTLYTSDFGGRVRAFDLASGVERLNFEAHPARIVDMALSPDGARLATAGDDGLAKVWNAGSGELLLTLAGHTLAEGGFFSGLMAVAFSPDGRLLATAANDGLAKVWDLSTGAELLTLQGHERSVAAVAFSPDGKIIATSGDDNWAGIWDAETGALLMKIPSPTRMLGLSLSPDGSRLATGGDQGLVRVWSLPGDLRNAAEAPSQPLLSFITAAGVVLDVQYSPDGTQLAVTGSTGVVEIRDAETGALVQSIAHPAGVWALRFSSDGAHLATGGTDGIARVLTLDTDELIDIARSRVTRDLTDQECQTYLHLSECPKSAE